MKNKEDLRITRTYLLLHNAFTEMLTEKAFEDISVKDLCERAMIRRTTFYKHFADKYEYLHFYLREIRDEFRCKSESLSDETTKAYVLRMTKKLIEFLNEHENMVNRILNSNMLVVFLDSLAKQIITDLSQILEKDAKTRPLPVPAEILASFVTGGLLQTLLWWFDRKEIVSEEKLFQAISSLFNAFAI